MGPETWVQAPAMPAAHRVALGKSFPFPEQCCSELWGTCVSFNCDFLSVYDQQWDFWVIWEFYFQFFKESLHCSP